MTSLQRYITENNLEIEKDMGSPTFTCVTGSLASCSGTYAFIPSVAQFTRHLESGGYELVKLLTGTVRLFNCDGSEVFTIRPKAQQKIIYSVDNLLYRIESMHYDPSQSYFRLVAEGVAKGI
jgi:hypothetical protein